MLFLAREAWQNSLLLLEPANATGAEPKNDSDGDGCPEVVLIEDDTEADIEADSPIQDGYGITEVDEGNPDNQAANEIHSVSPYSPWSDQLVSKCHYLLKRDSIDFMQDHF